MITPYSNPTEDEFVHHEIANNFDSYDGNSDVAYESEFEQLTEYIPNDIYFNEGEDVVYDDTPSDPDALMNDIFGVDSDDEVDTVVVPGIPGLRAVPDLVTIHWILPPTVHIQPYHD